MKKFAFCFLFLVTGCHVVSAPPPATPKAAPSEQPNSPGRSPVPKEAFNPENLNFETVYKYVIGPRCIKCHGDDVAEDDVYLKTYQGVIFSLEEVEKQVLRGKMPPPKKTRPLHPDQRALLLKWIKANAPERSPAPIEAVGP